jgi:hypothetical protein
LIGPLQYKLTPHTFPSFQRLLDKAIALEHKRRERLLTKDKLEVVPVPIILHLKVHLPVAVPGNRINRPKLLLKQTLQWDLLLLIHPPTGHASNVDRVVIMRITIPIGLLIPL